MHARGDGRHLAYSCGGGNGAGYTVLDFDPAHLFDAVNRRAPIAQFDVGAYPGSVDFSADSTRLLVENGALTVFDVATHEELASHSVTSLAGFSSSTYRTARWSLGDGLLHVDAARGDSPHRLVWVRAD